MFPMTQDRWLKLTWYKRFEVSLVFLFCVTSFLSLVLNLVNKSENLVKGTETL